MKKGVVDMKKKMFFAFIVCATTAVVVASSATYNDLGDLAGQTEATSGGFWDTTERSAIAIERTASVSSASGFDSRTKISSESNAAISVRRTPKGMTLSFR